jgi:hypothetical protein
MWGAMSKAVLVMDMPESCSKCKFMYEFQETKKCQLMNVLNNGASKLSQSTFTEKRHDWCPLRELPEKIPELKSGYEDLSTSIRRVGFNACLDEILK